MKQIRITLLLFIFVFSGQVLSAQSQQVHQAIEKRLTELHDNQVIPPSEMLLEVNNLIITIEKNHWLKTLVVANALKIELLVLLEQFTQAERLIDTFFPQAINQKTISLIIRYELSKLLVEDMKGVSENLIPIRESLLKKAENVKDESLVVLIYMGLGLSEYTADNYTNALKYYKQAYDVQYAQSSERVTSNVLVSIANIYLDLEDIDKGKEYYKQALEIDRANNNKFSESIALYNLANAYMQNGEYQEAKKSFQQSLKLSLQLNDDVGVKWAQFSLADIFIQEEQWQQALNYFSEAAATFSQSGDMRMHFSSLSGVFDAQIGLGHISDSEETITQAKPLLDNINEDEYKATYTEMLAQFAYANGEFKEAYKQQKKYTEQKQIIYKNKQKQKSQKYRAQFDTELKENEIKILLKESELSNLKIEQQEQQQKYWVLIIILATAIIFSVIFLLFKQIQHRNRFKAMALKDHLTNSPNRRAILQYAETRYQEALHTEMELSIAIIDLDFFKKINDTYGHHVGDEVLKSFAIACQKVMRKQDRYGRYGGEEWLFVLTDTNKNNIHIIFERLHQELNNISINGLPEDFYITFSMGVSQHNPERMVSLQSLISSADEKLYQAKEAGRHRIEI